MDKRVWAAIALIVLGLALLAWAVGAVAAGGCTLYVPYIENTGRRMVRSTPPWPPVTPGVKR